MLLTELSRESGALTVVDPNEFSRERGGVAVVEPNEFSRKGGGVCKSARSAALLARGELVWKGSARAFGNAGDIRCCSCFITICAIALSEAWLDSILNEKKGITLARNLKSEVSLHDLCDI